MFSANSKYKRKISAVILACYLLVSVLSIFHYHSYNFNQTISVDKLTSSDINLKKADLSGFNCIIHQNITSLHSVRFSLHFILVDAVSEHEYLKTENVRLETSLYYTSNKLRAPPIYS